MIQEGTQYIIDGSGELIAYPDPYKNVTPELAEQAENFEKEILAVKQHTELNWVRLALHLSTFKKQKLYLACGHDSMAAWAKNSGVGLSYGMVCALIRIADVVYPIAEEAYPDPAIQLATIGISKVRVALPILRDDDGKSKFVTALYTAQYLTLNDFKDYIKEVRGMGGKPDDPLPIIFKAHIEKRDDFAFLNISGNDGIKFSRIGVLKMPIEWLPRWEERFGRFVQYHDE